MSADDLNTIGFVLGEASRLMRRRFDDYARAQGVTQQQWLVLIALMRQEPVSQVALAQYLEVEPMSLCRMADRLQAAGMVERQPDPSDRRVRLLSLTPAARELLVKLRRHGRKVMDLATEGFPPEHQALLMASLEQMRLNLMSDRADQLLAETLAEDALGEGAGG